MVRILDLPPEILQTILHQTDPATWVSLSLSSKTLKDFIDRDHLLYKDYYLKTWDRPKAGTISDAAKWKDEVKRFFRLIKILESTDDALKTNNFQFVTDGVLELITNASLQYHAKNIELLRRNFNLEKNQRNFMCQSTPFVQTFPRSGAKYIPIQASSYEHRQISAKLHCLYGKAIVLSDAFEEVPLLYSFACAHVYDRREYNDKTMWGPFESNGSGNVDWEKMEAIMIILTFILRQSKIFSHHLVQRIWNYPFSGIGRQDHIFQDETMIPQSPQTKTEDVYGIEGTWIRVICIPNLESLAEYNFELGGLLPDESRPPYDADLAMRIIAMQLSITKVEQPEADDNQALPVVHFHGRSKAIFTVGDHVAAGYSQVRGYLRLTQEGEVRWTTFSMYRGREQWRSEGIQVGGLRSARGVMGYWFDKDYDTQGPVGPTASWKIGDSNAFHSYDIGEADSSSGS